MGEVVAIKTKMDYGIRMGLSPEAADTLWERAATRIIEYEDAGEMDVSPKTIWSDLARDHPTLYPPNMTMTYVEKCFKDEDFLAYLSIRREEHIIRTMPLRQHADKFFARIMEKAGSELYRRLAQNPDQFSNSQLIKILNEAASGRAKVQEGLTKGAKAGDDKPQTVINAFQFINQLPVEQRAGALAYVAQIQSEPIIEGEAKEE